jgi:hypothetical protein
MSKQSRAKNKKEKYNSQWTRTARNKIKQLTKWLDGRDAKKNPRMAEIVRDKIKRLQTGTKPRTKGA